MNDFSLFIWFISYLFVIRITELIIAKTNENWMRRRGAIEFGASHYPYMVSMHILFFISLIFEKVFFNRGLAAVWPVIFTVFVLTQFLRVWVIASLGRYWNTKILVLPNAKVIMKGPYRFLRHPNYCVVSLEFIVIPLLFSAYYTFVVYSLLNLFILSVRIPEEEKALKSLTEYEGSFHAHKRFLPKFVK